MGMPHLNRRNFVASVASAGLLPLAAHAQRKAMPIVAYLSPGTPEAIASNFAPFYGGLKDVGYTNGQNVAIEFQWARGRNEQLPSLAAELVARKVDVIVTGGMPSTRAAKNATSTIPIVFMVGVDPVATGLVASLARPESNLTGFTVFGPALAVKRFELLSELLPEARVMAYLTNPANPATSVQQVAGNTFNEARAKGVQLHLLDASNGGEIEAAFASLRELKVDGLLVGVDPLFYNQQPQIVSLAARYQTPTIYDTRSYVAAGGFISYGAKEGEVIRSAGNYAGRILSGARPIDLPVQQPAKFELVINLKTANALGLTIPLSILTRADEVIE